MNILIDATLPPRTARSLHTLLHPGHSVSHVRDILGNDASDQHISDHLRDHPDTIMIGVDVDITSHPHRLAALRAHQRSIFLLASAWTDEPVLTQAWMLINWMPRMIQTSESSKSAAIYLVPASPSGRIRKVS